MRVIVTRPAAQAGKWVADLRAAGLDAVSLPLIAIGPPPDLAALEQAWAQLADYAALMFVSSNAVDGFFASKPAVLPAWKHLPTRFWVTGPGSHAALLRQGVPPDRIDAPSLQAGQLDSEALWAVVQGQVQAGFRCLVVRGAVQGGPLQGAPQQPPQEGGVGRDWLTRTLRAAGAQVDLVAAYARALPVLQANAQALAQVAATHPWVWLFTSAEAIDNLRALCPGQSWKHARAVVTHPRIAQAARQAGFGVVCESRPALGELLASIESLA